MGFSSVYRGESPKWYAEEARQKNRFLVTKFWNRQNCSDRKQVGGQLEPRMQTVKGTGHFLGVMGGFYIWT